MTVADEGAALNAQGQKATESTRNKQEWCVLFRGRGSGHKLFLSKVTYVGMVLCRQSRGNLQHVSGELSLKNIFEKPPRAQEKGRNLFLIWKIMEAFVKTVTDNVY